MSPSAIQRGASPHPTHTLLQGFCPQMASCEYCLLAGGQTGKHAEVRDNG